MTKREVPRGASLALQVSLTLHRIITPTDSSMNSGGDATVSYWASVTNNRLTRRRALASSAAGALGAAFVAACGGGSDAPSGDTGPKKDASSLVFTPSDSTGQAKAGGTLKNFASADMNPSFDSLANNGSAPLSISAAYAYPRLVKYGVRKYPKEYDNSFEGDMAKSWEISPDHLTLTFKLRQGVKW